MNRLELLRELYNYITYNICCYSKDSNMEIPKSEYEENWHKEREKLGIIEELIEEEKTQNFHLYTSIYNLNNDRENRINHDLAYLVERENGVSCFLTLREKEEGETPEYELVFNIHKKDEFDDEYENIYSINIEKEAFKDRETLKQKMQDGLDSFKEFIERDKRKNRFFSKYYESEEIEELE